MTVRELLQLILDEGRFDLDDEIKVCMISDKDDESTIKFEIKEAEEFIYIAPVGLTSDQKPFKIKLPKCQIHKTFMEGIHD
jgi:hypothetical protein|tara:strand:- start:415 stop:657 length:243 start_codon:yes stop_codon:yes gene_type:complete